MTLMTEACSLEDSAIKTKSGAIYANFCNIVQNLVCLLHVDP